MNLPNKLTVSRLALTLVFLVVIFIEFKWHNTIALVIFSVASITDYFDGRIARQRKLITNFGILMDPLADKILTCSAFIALVEWPAIGAIEIGDKTIEIHVYAWMVCVIVGRELAITGLRMMAASKDVVLAAEGFGKHKTVSQMVCLVAMLTLISVEEWGAFGASVFGGWLPWLAFISLWVSVILTLYSGTIYLWNNRNIYLDDM